MGSHYSEFYEAQERENAERKMRERQAIDLLPLRDRLAHIKRNAYNKEECLDSFLEEILYKVESLEEKVWESE